jgi:ABC-2 type transport system permease protein
MSTSLSVQVRTLASRSIKRTLRQPAIVIPNLVFPLFMLAVVSSGGKQVTQIKGFPTTSYLTFVLGSMLVQGATGAATMAGDGVGTDIETGFLNRLSLTPMKGTVLLVAQLAGVAVLGFVQAVIYLVVGLIGGAHVAAGVGGALALIAVVVLLAIAFGSIGLLVAVRTGSAAQVQALVALALALLFMSSMLMPRNLIKEQWFKTVATYNPMSYLVEAPRSLLVTGWDGQALALGCGIALGIMFVALTAAVWIMRRSVARV